MVVPYAARVNLRCGVETATELHDRNVTASFMSQMQRIDPLCLVANSLVIFTWLIVFFIVGGASTTHEHLR
jgi:hypothetical protein